MFQQTNQSKLPIQGENSLYISDIQKGSNNSHIFRNLLVDYGYIKFEGKTLKGDNCYDAYYKYFKTGEDLKYTIYCYCYDFKNILDDPELFEFVFESQIESERGIIGIESIQWDFTNTNEAKSNLIFFQEKIEMIWTSLGSKKFPN
jgi:hypothetical protein